MMRKILALELKRHHVALSGPFDMNSFGPVTISRLAAISVRNARLNISYSVLFKCDSVRSKQLLHLQQNPTYSEVVCV